MMQKELWCQIYWLSLDCWWNPKFDLLLLDRLRRMIDIEYFFKSFLIDKMRTLLDSKDNSWCHYSVEFLFHTQWRRSILGQLFDQLQRFLLQPYLFSLLRFYFLRESWSKTSCLIFPLLSAINHYHGFDGEQIKHSSVIDLLFRHFLFIHFCTSLFIFTFL